MTYEMGISHDDGARHLKLLDSDLLGIGACSHYSPLAPLIFSKFSDRYGRVKFLGLNITSLLLADAALAALAVAPEYVPGGYWFLFYASAFEGLIGGGFRPQNLTTLNDTLLSCRTFSGHCRHPCVSC
jgi:MFS family permease